MAKITLNDLANLQNESTAVSTFNANNVLIETAMENTLSRDGTSPNQMSADLDMNSHRIYNLLDASTNQEPITLNQLNAVTTLGGASPINAAYILASANSTLGSARVLTQGTGLLFTDAGAGHTYTLGLDIGNTRNVDHTAVTITAGSGLTGGGDLSSTRTLNVGAGTGITVNADDIAITVPVTPQLGGTGVVNNSANTLTLSGAFGLTLTLSGTTSLTLPTSGTVATLSNNLGQFASTTSAQLASVLSDETGSGSNVFGTNPTVSILSGGLTVADSLLSIVDDGDSTKILKFQASGITTGNTRTLTVPNTSGTIALTSNLLSDFAATSSAQLASIISDETGSGLLMFGSSPRVTTDIAPSVSGGATLGTSALPWDNAFFISGASFNWNSGDVLLTHSTNSLAFTGASNGYTFDSNIKSPIIYGGTATGSTLSLRPTSGAGTTSANILFQLGNNGGTTIGSMSGGSSATVFTIGTGSPSALLYGGSVTDIFQILGTDTAGSSMSIGRGSADASGPIIHLQKTRSPNNGGSATVVVSGDTLGSLLWVGDTGAVGQTGAIAASIKAAVDGTPGSGDMPGRLVFSTTADGAASVTDRLILDNTGVLKPNANDGVPLGTGALSFSDLFLASGGVINFNNGNSTLTHSAGLITSNVNIAVPDDAYDATTWNGSTNVPTKNAIRDKIETLAGATLVGFSAHKNGTDQTGVADSTYTQLTFGTEIYDNGNFFASNAWTPPAGHVVISAGLLASGTIASGSDCIVSIYKNAAAFKSSVSGTATNEGSAGISITDTANGTDVYTAFVYVDTTAGTGTINGGSTVTFFMGEWLHA